MNPIEIPNATKVRLIQLLQLLKDWPKQKITSLDISKATNWKSSLIRHDFWLIGFSKGVSNGYAVCELQQAIKNALGIQGPDSIHNKKESNGAYVQNTDSETSSTLLKNICIVGLDRLGSALLDERFFENSGFKIKAGFDSNVNRVEILRSVFPLYPATEMAMTIKREKIEYAILTVSDKDAQNMTNRLFSAGIKGIVNMTNVILKVPEYVKVQNLSILNSLNLIV